MWVVLFRVVFSNRKTLFLDILYFLCLLCSLRGYLFQCKVSSVYHVCHKLIFRVRLCMGIFHLILYVLDNFQVLLDVQNRQRLENVLFFCPCFYFLWCLVRVVRFYNHRKVVLYYFGRMIRDQVGFYFRLKHVNNVLSCRKMLLWIYILRLLLLGLLNTASLLHL